MRLRTRQALRQARLQYEQSLAAQACKVLVCAGTGCISSGSLEIYERLKELIQGRGLHCAVELEEEPHPHAVGVKKSGCHGFCELGPLVRLEPWGYLYTRVRLEDCEEIVARTVVAGEHIPRLAYTQGETVYEKQSDIPFYQKQTRVVLERCGHIDATSIKEYLADGGYTAFEKALFDLTDLHIIQTITDAGLRGRGGGGFPTGRKWSQVQRQPKGQKYIVCNGDEGDPGAFMDRSIMEGDPHRLLEGMMIAGLACGADTGYLYVRAEYPMAVERLTIAIEQATAWGLLGADILGTGFSFHIHINRGAGAFVCGEGSALTASIEGKRGMPRTKPPRTVEQGLFGCPTVLNNVETFANVPHILVDGAEWFKGFGRENNSGTKAFALTGAINNTGLIEVPMGTTLRQVIEEIGGGIRGGRSFKAVQIGGPSGGCLIETNMDLPLDFDSLKKVGGMIGSGGLVVMDDTTCMVEVARFFMNFTQNESCGKCVPCREGTRRMLEILDRIVEGRGVAADIDLLYELADTVSNTALCGLGKTASNPVLGTILHFREEYEAHIRDGHCPANQCPKLRRIWIEAEACKGCSKCARGCPVDAISGKLKEPYTINPDKCIKCGACVEACPFHAVKEG